MMAALVKLIKNCVLALFLIGSGAQLASAAPFQGKYLPWKQTDLGSTFSQKKLAEISPSLFQKYKNLSFKVSNWTLTVSGVDSHHKSWHFSQPVTVGGGAIWQADLGDDGGQPDLLILLNTAACGIAPPSQLIVIKFDQGKPQAATIYGFFEADSKGIVDLRKLSDFKQAVLVQQCLVNQPVANKNFWRTTMFRFDAPGLNHCLTSYKNVALPAYVLFAKTANHRVSRVDDLVSPDEHSIFKAI